ncbi:unnamed protein product (macronuclear) [Paramecium tetraurelia]|uniref:Uncharacterized protein n=1 Tax=Paramecium tetraurelia TaxID=5888 RepID=A0BEC1_PARTE|nr:uncharacterized protein GSPATT00027921001 [Paramecium tetraurelia]CAK56888.1 unnamed protein product [Paramecium tetraurelia]|eukprot:XP_001424286.1 hypothetical protein (macronuclear) [Paramecium tetraurelia strain d4-2]
MQHQCLIQFFIITEVLGMACNFSPFYFKQLVLQKQKEFHANSITLKCMCRNKGTDLGCISNLNQQACMQQQRNIQLTQRFWNKNGKQVKCFFRKRFIDANQFHLKNLDCDSNFSIYACVSVYGKNCVWTNKGLCYKQQ